MKTVVDSLKGKLIVSCQALENEPLHSSFIMSRMALAAAQGGAVGSVGTEYVRHQGTYRVFRGCAVYVPSGRQR